MYKLRKIGANMRDNTIKVGSRVKYIFVDRIKEGNVVKIDKGLFSKAYIIENVGLRYNFVDRVKEKDILEIINCD